MDNRLVEKDELLTRLRKIEGQVKGIQRMVDEDKCCSEVMVQISAIRSAINKVGGMMIERYIAECMQQGIRTPDSKGEIDESIQSMIETIVKYVK
ncbi:MAG: hypothetical protein K0R84_1398 [Clostridia bacterium]|jgi:DNA-binding FrmR family transcriptional regulator|nr:hypothetical protein [Clostridia bacterium]